MTRKSQPPPAPPKDVKPDPIPPDPITPAPPPAAPEKPAESAVEAAELEPGPDGQADPLGQAKVSTAGGQRGTTPEK